ncbi:YaaC family protein [Winogradskyella sp.]|uniref:YaaC family protein n=1 Tax=Winogradskyella sp. TaxID=1883156 RepID=UPI0026334E6D|nr:YaaC family protein [Winogradskyella sp.]
MTTNQITIGNKRFYLHKAIANPDFRSKSVLVEDTWDYVQMWLKRKRKNKALFYWEQAREFYLATLELPDTSAPLTTYYCFLNAVKSLLSVRGRPITENHGVTGKSTSQRAHLSNEEVTFHKGGVLAGLCEYLGEVATGQTYTLNDIFYNLVFIHRAYNLTFSSRPELFIPINNPRYVKKIGSTEAWFTAEISDERYSNQHSINKLPIGYEQDTSPEYVDNDELTIRRRRFRWRHGKPNQSRSIQNLVNYHRRVRKYLFYINGASRLWYIKRGKGPEGIINRSSMTLTYAAMHRLSELARYDPMLLAKHLDSQHNWLLSEFIVTARSQFLDEISSEITGHEFMVPGRKSVS